MHFSALQYCCLFLWIRLIIHSLTSCDNGYCSRKVLSPLIFIASLLICIRCLPLSKELLLEDSHWFYPTRPGMKIRPRESDLRWDSWLGRDWNHVSFDTQRQNLGGSVQRKQKLRIWNAVAVLWDLIKVAITTGLIILLLSSYIQLLQCSKHFKYVIIFATTGR